jgi:hypothetical protein
VVATLHETFVAVASRFASTNQIEFMRLLLINACPEHHEFRFIDPLALGALKMCADEVSGA